MTIVGFSFNRMVVERPETLHGKLSITNNIAIKKIERADVNLAQGQDALRFHFEYSAVYGQGNGNIILGGTTLYMVPGKLTQEILANWAEKKQLPKTIMQSVVNHIFNKCNIQALILSSEVNLPAPMPLPKFNMETQAGVAPVAPGTAADKRPAAKKVAKKAKKKAKKK